jgi:inosine/xanthosine triphosphatase
MPKAVFLPTLFSGQKQIVYRMKKIVVGSMNPVKIACIQEAWSAMSGSPAEVVGVEASSLVSEQPMSDIETFQGARNRALHAQQHHPQAEVWVGIEGGVDYWENEMMAFAWIVMVNGEGKWGQARTSAFQIPPAVRALVEEGIELGLANDRVFGKHNSKQSSGAVGILTDGALNRTEYYAKAAMLALVPFIRDGWY